MQFAVGTLASALNATKEMKLAHTLGAMMGRDDSSERPMLLRYCDSRRIVVPKVEIWFGFEGEECSYLRRADRTALLQVRGWADSRLTSMRFSDVCCPVRRMNQRSADIERQQGI